MLAPLVCAESKFSRKSIPAPSDRINPSLSLSNGFEALEGLSLFFDKAFIFANPDRVKGVILPSAPPQTIAFICPSEINLYAIPIASVAEEHAVDIEKFKPVRLFLIAI